MSIDEELLLNLRAFQVMLQCRVDRMARFKESVLRFIAVDFVVPLSIRFLLMVWLPVIFSTERLFELRSVWSFLIIQLNGALAAIMNVKMTTNRYQNWKENASLRDTKSVLRQISTPEGYLNFRRGHYSGEKTFSSSQNSSNNPNRMVYSKLLYVDQKD